MTTITRRAALALATAGLAAPALAQSRFPERPIRIGVMLTGGNVDPALLAGLIDRWGAQA